MARPARCVEQQRLVERPVENLMRSSGFYKIPSKGAVALQELMGLTHCPCPSGWKKSKSFEIEVERNFWKEYNTLCHELEGFPPFRRRIKLQLKQRSRVHTISLT
jgi:hypothetical protein